jgi:DNA-binding CsgD family transcriptional regulator
MVSQEQTNVNVGHPNFLARSTSEAEDLSCLIGEIYDTVLDQSRWPSVLKHLAVFVGGSAASLFAKRNGGKTGEIFYRDGSIPVEYEQIYFDRYIKLDPSAIGQFCFEIGEAFSTEDLLDYNEFTASRFYKEWAFPLGLVDFLAVALDKSAEEIALLGVFRSTHQGLVDAEMRQRMNLIVPHVRRAVFIGKKIATNTAESAALADCFDGLVAGVFLVDANGRIVHANASGMALIAADDIVHVRGGLLALNNIELGQTLREVLATNSSGRSDPVIAVGPMAMAIRAKGGAHYSANILPLSSGVRQKAGVAYKAVAAVFIQAATMETRAPAEMIARSWKLTPTELRVLLAIVEVGGVPEVAIALGIAETTVKSHLGHLYGKTGTSRQADLVKLVAGFSNPLRTQSDTT